MKIKKIIELAIIKILCFLNLKIARIFAFRKSRNLTFSTIYRKHGEAELLLLPYLLNKDAYFIDIGANRGLYCFYSERIIPECNIVAFEPIPRLSNMLSRLFPKIVVVEKALSDHTGEAILHIPMHPENYLLDTRSTLDRNSHELSGQFQTISVEIIPLDDCLENLNVRNIGLIKIDVEGHEIKVLSGAKKTLMNKRPFLIIEIESKHHDNDITKSFECIDQLEYSIYFWDSNTLALKLAYSPDEKQSVPFKIIQKIHNYVCFPKEKVGYAETINQLISKDKVG